MNARFLRHLLLREDINFLLTNRLPRVALTRLFGRLSRIRSRRLTRFCIALWRLFTDLDLSEARSAQFDSLHACFTRELQPGARPFDPRADILPSPCDAIVGDCGLIEHDTLFQAKGMPYTLSELCASAEPSRELEGGFYATLRLTSAMYHRFHSPLDGVLDQVDWIAGDAWNVNPPALARVDRLFCRNERAVLRCRLEQGGHALALVPVAAVLVASIRLHFLDVLMHLRWQGPNEMPCDAPHTKGQEMGWFQHGSTIIVFAPPGFELCVGVAEGTRLRMGMPLMRVPPQAS